MRLGHETGLAANADHLLVKAQTKARGQHHPGVGGQLVERHGGQLRQRMRRRQRQQQRLGVHRQGFQSRVVHGRAHEAHLNLAAMQGANLLRGGHLAQRNIHARIALAEPQREGGDRVLVGR